MFNWSYTVIFGSSWYPSVNFCYYFGLKKIKNTLTAYSCTKKTRTPEVPTRLKLLLLGMTIVLSPEDIYVFKFPDWEDIKLKHDHCFGQCYYFTFELVYVYQPKNVPSVNSKCPRVIFFRKIKLTIPQDIFSLTHSEFIPTMVTNSVLHQNC